MSFLKRIFKRESARSLDPGATAPLKPHLIESDLGPGSQGHLIVGVAHSAGLERPHDDDSSFVLTGGADGDQKLPDFGLFCVADGLGGYEHGHIASSIAVRTVARVIIRGALLDLFNLEPATEIASMIELVTGAFEEANRAVLTDAEGGATTLTTALLMGDQMVIGHVGDTRVYSIVGEEMKCLTHDHSLIQRLIESGTLSEDEAQESPHRGVLWNAIGKTEELKVDVASYAVSPASYLLLCSDGLWGVVPEDEVYRVVTENRNPQPACDALVRTANDAGGPDNITAILVHIPTF
jgi:protein phosphatase